MSGFDEIEPALPESRVWITRDGRRVTPRQMSTDHIKNVLGMMDEKSELYYLLKEEYNYRQLLLKELRDEIRRSDI